MLVTQGSISLEYIKDDIVLKDIHFNSPMRLNKLLFEGSSLFILSGTTMALVEESGCGESIVINLVERFYDTQSTEMLVDGVILKRLRPNSLQYNEVPSCSTYAASDMFIKRMDFHVRNEEVMCQWVMAENLFEMSAVM